MHPFIHLFIGFCLYTALQCQSSMLSNSLIFHTSGGISSSPAVFLFLIFLRTESSSCVNGPSLMSTYNSYDWFMHNFWRVLRNPSKVMHEPITRIKIKI